MCFYIEVSRMYMKSSFVRPLIQMQVMHYAEL